MKLIVVGSGPGGYTAAFEAAGRGWQVALVEKDRMGGVCLNHGCIPTKSMRASADALNMARRMAEFGVTGCKDAQIDPDAVQKRKQKIIEVLVGGLEKSCARLKIDYHRGDARIVGPGLVSVKTGADSIMLEGDAIIIATGSGILELPGLAFDHKNILDSNDALELDTVPQSILIVGGGVIGCELACIYRAFGSEVTIVEGQDRLLPIPSVDADISALLAREMRKRKIRMFTGCTLKDVTASGDSCEGTITASPFVPAEKAGVKADAAVKAEKIFVTVGRKPNTAGLGLEKAGIKTDKRGWIEAGANLETSVPGIYAIGDVLGPSRIMLAHVAAMEGLRAVDVLAGKNVAMDYAVVPSAIFTEPEIGSVGLSEAQAREVCAKVICGTTQIRELGKAQAMGELPGFCKIVADGENGKILGVHIAGAHSSDLVAEAALAMARGITVYDLANVIHAHPTLAETLFETARETIRKLGE